MKFASRFTVAIVLVILFASTASVGAQNVSERIAKIPPQLTDRVEDFAKRNPFNMEVAELQMRQIVFGQGAVSGLSKFTMHIPDEDEGPQSIALQVSDNVQSGWVLVAYTRGSEMLTHLVPMPYGMGPHTPRTLPPPSFSDGSGVVVVYYCPVGAPLVGVPYEPAGVIRMAVNYPLSAPQPASSAIDFVEMTETSFAGEVGARIRLRAVGRVRILVNGLVPQALVYLQPSAADDGNPHEQIYFLPYGSRLLPYNDSINTRIVNVGIVDAAGEVVNRPLAVTAPPYPNYPK